MKKNQPSNGPQVADNYDEETLRSIAPEAFGPQGFDPLRAQLLITGHFVPPDVASALRARSTEVNSRRVSRQPIVNPASGSNGDASAAATEKPSYRAKWTEEMTERLIRLHAERVSFKDITTRIPGKEIKGCQEHYYRSVKIEKWKRLHERLRKEHDGDHDE